MIANLITTLLLALGVATGSYQSESGNAFNQANEKPIQKATETNNYSLQLEKRIVSDWHDSVQGNAVFREYKKYYLGTRWGNDPTLPNHSLPNMLLYDTLYTFSKPLNNEDNSTYWESEAYLVMQITNIYNGTTTFTMETEFIRSTYNQSEHYTNTYVYSSTDDNVLNLIDLTINQGAYNTFKQIYDNLTLNYLTGTYNDTPDNEDVVWITNTTPNITLQPNQTIYIILHTRDTYRRLDFTSSGGIVPGLITVKGSYIAPTYTQEIVNVPELMFTIVTLPFAFYSTAFNLTIFPNTPYALNFGNLILTILAALILLYLIKKVLK